MIVKMYLASLGGLGFWIIFMLAIVVSNLANIVETWFMGYWASQYEGRASTEVRTSL